MSKPYNPPLVEQWVTDKLKAADIFYPDQLDPERVAAAFGVDYLLWHGITFSYRGNPDGRLYIVNNADVSEPERRYRFFHELAHALRHAGDQCDMAETFRQAQEWDANLCAMYAAIPFHMIDFNNGYTIYTLMDEFTVTKNLARRRAEDIRQKTIAAEQFHNEGYDPAPARSFCIDKCSGETKRIIDQLARQIGRKIG